MQPMQDYSTFINQKRHLEGDFGFAPITLPDQAFDFQKHLIEWATRKGRAAIFADCGLGKTLMQLSWADNVNRQTNKPVLILTPLAVSGQTCREADKFSIEAARSRDGKVAAGITVTNYEKLHLFEPSDFAGVVCDESSILKNFDGAIKAMVTEFMKKLPYRLLTTATAAPNDYIELGTSSEALGHLGYMDMLGMFFKNNENSLHPRQLGTAWHGVKWRFKAHAEVDFWRWVCSWARAVRKPSDLGFEDDQFVLPPLNVRQHIVDASRPMDGFLFTIPAKGLAEQRQERSNTVEERCERVSEIVDHDRPAAIWCHLNREADLLEDLVPEAMQVSGSQSDERKEEIFEAFASGQLRCLITKPKIGAFGLNWQHCSDVTTFPSHSFEQYYQLIRRCWRFGQPNEVTVDIVSTEGESDVLANLQRKEAACVRMFEKIVAEMNHSLSIASKGVGDEKPEVPSWLKNENTTSLTTS